MDKQYMTFESGLSGEGLYEINELLERHGMFPLPDWFSREHLADQLDLDHEYEFVNDDDELELSYPTCRGTIAKRISQYQRRATGKRVPKQVTDKIGTLAAMYTSRAKFVVPYDITYNVCDWVPGAFGEGHNSCYWGKYLSGPILIKQNGGFAIRVYDPNHPDIGVGRAMVLPRPTFFGQVVHVVFNGYLKDGIIPTVVDIPAMFMASVLARHLGDHNYYRAVSITNNDELDGPLYLNNDAYGWAVAPAEALADVPDLFDLEIDTSEWMMCDLCETMFYTHELDSIDGEDLCEDCVDMKIQLGELVRCDYCDELYAPLTREGLCQRCAVVRE